MLAGGFKNDLLALGDDHAARRAVRAHRRVHARSSPAAARRRPVTFDGRYYQVQQPALTPPLPAELMPEDAHLGLLAGRAGGRGEIGASAGPVPRAARRGVRRRRTGRSRSASASASSPASDDGRGLDEVAHERFPDDRGPDHPPARDEGVRLAVAPRSSRASSRRRRRREPTRTGSARSRTTRRSARTSSARYDRVAEAVARYVERGLPTFILDIPPSAEELEHIAVVFRAASGS